VTPHRANYTICPLDGGWSRGSARERATLAVADYNERDPFAPPPRTPPPTRRRFNEEFLHPLISASDARDVHFVHV
jgi:hypothetical protein